MGDNYLNPEFKVGNLDSYVIRTAIRDALVQCLPQLHGKLLDLGCGSMPYKKLILENSGVEEYIGLDIETARDYGSNRGPDWRWDGTRIPCEDCVFDAVIATEVLEHCPDPNVVLAEVWRVMKQEGLFFFTVPFLWNLHEVPNDEYRYTPFALERLLKEAGFKHCTIRATGGWHASMAQMLGLWVRRSRMSPRKRRFLSHVVKALMGHLLRKDTVPETFREGSMITGLYGTARVAK